MYGMCLRECKEHRLQVKQLKIVSLVSGSLEHFKEVLHMYSLCFTKSDGDVAFGSIKLEFCWKSILLHAKLKRIEF